MTVVEIRGADGLPVFCACGRLATGSNFSITGNKATWHCDDCNPAGPPCPHCHGTGRLPR